MPSDLGLPSCLLQENFSTLRILCQLCQEKTHRTHPLIFSVNEFGKYFHCVIPSAFLSLSPPSATWAPSSLQHQLSISLPNQVSASLIFHNVASSPSNCAICSVSPQIDFLAIQNELIFIQLCLRDVASLRSLTLPS